jgi:hypothetical protein
MDPDDHASITWADGADAYYRTYSRNVGDGEERYRLVAMHIDDAKILERWELMEHDRLKTKTNAYQNNWRRVGVDGRTEYMSVFLGDRKVGGDVVKIHWAAKGDKGDGGTGSGSSGSQSSRPNKIGRAGQNH